MKIALTLKHLLRDRPIIALWTGCFVVVMLTLIISGLQIKASELNIPTRYTTFGVTHIYNEAWYYLIGFLCFMVVSLALHSLIALKLYDRKGVVVARLFMVISLMTTIVASFYVAAVIGVASLLQQ